jgi:hypothetical protein
LFVRCLGERVAVPDEAMIQDADQAGLKSRSIARLTGLEARGNNPPRWAVSK